MLFPAVTVTAGLQALAAFIVRSDERAALPILTNLHLIAKEIRTTAEILEVVRVHALSLVVFMVEGTPFGFEVEDEEIEVAGLDAWHEVVDEADFDVLDRVRKRTVIPVLTLANFIRVKVAKLGFVLVPVVKTLHPVVCPPAPLVLRTLLRLSEFAKLRRVQLVFSPLVLDAVEEEATLMVVRIASIRTFKALEVT